jgi:hypothetical protein
MVTKYSNFLTVTVEDYAFKAVSDTKYRKITEYYRGLNTAVTQLSGPDTHICLR